MNSSWKRRASSAIFLATLLLAALLPVGPAEAAGCPTTPVSEAGGTHWCYDHDASKGHVHLWTPPGFKPESAITAIYIHGHHLNSDPCPIAHYIDCAWDAHHLASQFAASGVNALFVAVEAPTSNGPVKWGSLGSLLKSIKDKGNVVPSEKVTVLGHSYGMKTARALWADARVNHLVTLDWVHGGESPPFDVSIAAWYKADDSRRLTIVSGSSGQTGYGLALANSLSCPTRAGTSALSADEKAGRCLHINAGGGHMETVTQGKTIPLALSRSLAGTASGTTSTTPNAPTDQPTGGPNGIVIIPRGPTTYGGPTLEIPVPGIEFSNVVNQNGEITIPWLAQYVGGVYTFLLSIAGLLAAVMMVVGGFQYVTSGGDKGKVGEGKKKIVNALTGLVLALGSYTILYSINPDLVAFKGLTISTTDTFALQEDETNAADESGLIDTSSTGTVPIGEFGQPTAICNSEATCKPFCDRYFAEDPALPLTAPGMAKPSDVQVIPNTNGVNGFGNSASPTTIGLLNLAGPMFANKGYKLAVTSGYRDLHGQLKVACEAWKNGDGGAVGHTIAYPGGSFHGVGYAIDVQLYKVATPKNEKLTISGDRKGQQSVDPRYASDLADIMLRAGFRRLNNEIWHFEPANAPAVGCRCYTLDKCSMPPNVKC